MKNHNEMTLAECVPILFPRWHDKGQNPGWRDDSNGSVTITLDMVAGAMPDGFYWLRHRNPLAPVGWKAKAYCPCWKALRRTNNATIAIIEDTGDEKLDRARLAVACWRATKGGA